MGKDRLFYTLAAEQDPETGKFTVHSTTNIEKGSEEERAALVALHRAACEMQCGPYAATMNLIATDMTEHKLLGTSVEKQDIAKIISGTLRRYNLAVAHPDTGEPCNLIAINDIWGGKFALENRKTKKRSRTCRQMTALVPFKLIPIPFPEDDDA